MVSSGCRLVAVRLSLLRTVGIQAKGMKADLRIKLSSDSVSKTESFTIAALRCLKRQADEDVKKLLFVGGDF